MITPIQGRRGRVEFNGVVLNIDNSDVIFTTDEVKVTGFCDQQADGRTPIGRCSGLDDFSGTISGYVAKFDDVVPNGITGAGKIIVGLPGAYGITQGAIWTNLKLYLDKNIVPLYCGCTRVMVYRVNYAVKINDAWKFSVEVKCATGQIAHPKELVTET